MGIAIFLLGILGIAAVIGFAVIYVTAIVMLATLAATYLVTLVILYSLLGEENTMLAVALAFPISLGSIFAINKLMNK